MCGSDIFLGILAIFFPPLAVWVKRGICSADSLINLALCCLAYLPGLLHAWYIISVTPSPTYDHLSQHDPERGHITHYYVHTQPGSHPPPPGGPQGYGTVNNVPNAQFPGQQQGMVKPPRSQRAAAPASASAAPPAAQASQAGQSEEIPPSYAQAVAGDHKIQGP